MLTPAGKGELTEVISLIFLEDLIMFISRKKIGNAALAALAFIASAVSSAQASELDLVIPSLSQATYSIFGLEISGNGLLLSGMAV